MKPDEIGPFADWLEVWMKNPFELSLIAFKLPEWIEKVRWKKRQETKIDDTYARSKR